MRGFKIKQKKEKKTRKSIDWLVWFFCDCLFQYCLHKIKFSSKTFFFQGKKYNYFCSLYQATWVNERAVEVPIVWEAVKEYKGRSVLEIGNVLSHYFFVRHDILDYYEKAPRVINEDVVDFSPNKKYDLIVSISTLEHVGFNEEKKEPKKILQAIKNLKSLLSKKGKILLTLPLGFNPEMDKLLGEGKMEFSKIYCMKRISGENEWIETSWKEIKNSKYNFPFNGANGLVVGVIEN